MVRRMFSSISSNFGEATRWCIKSLAEMNKNKLVLEANIINNQNNPFLLSTKRSLYPPSSPKNKPSSGVAKILLREICLRLARQNGLCAEMLSHVAAETADNEVKQNKPAITKNHNKQGRVIKAVNSSLKSFKEEKTTQLIRIEEQKALKLLQNLHRLHTDTYQLANNLIQENNIVCQRFNNADQNIIEAAMEQIRSRHANTVEDLADVVVGLRKFYDLKQHRQQLQYKGHKTLLASTCTHDSRDERHQTLLPLIDTFLRGRNGIQLLCDHYIGFCKGRPHGGISANVNIWDVAQEAFLEAQHLCDANHGFSPELVPAQEHDAYIPPLHMIRPWVYHALVEVFKNAMTSSVEKSKRLSSVPSSMQLRPPPPIQVRISHDADQQLTSIQVIDEGIGLNDHSRQKAFIFAETSQSRRWDRLHDQQSYAAVRAPLASLGVGLPLSRTMMQMFGGDITLLENKFHGCTATLVLSNDPTVLEN